MSRYNLQICCTFSGRVLKCSVQPSPTHEQLTEHGPPTDKEKVKFTHKQWKYEIIFVRDGV